VLKNKNGYIPPNNGYSWAVVLIYEQKERSAKRSFYIHLKYEINVVELRGMSPGPFEKHSNPLQA